MAEFQDDDLSGSTFRHVRLRGSTFTDVDLSGVVVRDAWWPDAELRGVMFPSLRMRGVELQDADVYGEIGRLIVNGVDVTAYVEAELDRRHPERPLMRPTDADGFRTAWDVLERLWAGTVERARALPPELLHESVEGEWSFIQTLRHLAFATECWLLRAVQGEPRPWDPLSLPWDEAPPTEGVPHDREARPDLDTALALRHDRSARVRAHLERLTDAELATTTTPVEAPGWPPPESFSVQECLRVILNEEWEHRLYAERDLAVLEARDD